MSTNFAPKIHFFLKEYTGNPPLCMKSVQNQWKIMHICIFWRYSATSSKKLTGRKPSLQEIMADFGFLIHPS